LNGWGGEESIPVDVRIICATHRNLEEMVHSGLFREDLLYRLNVFPIMIPPLRQRKEDIPAFLNHFLQKKAIELRIDGNPIPTPAAIERLKAHHWPGNVRELENVVERELILSKGQNESALLTFQSMVFHRQESRSEGFDATDIQSLDEAMARHIQHALTLTRGKIYGPDGAAEHLKIHPNTLRARMEKLGFTFDRRKRI